MRSGFSSCLSCLISKERSWFVSICKVKFYAHLIWARNFTEMSKRKINSWRNMRKKIEFNFPESYMSGDQNLKKGLSHWIVSVRSQLWTNKQDCILRYWAVKALVLTAWTDEQVPWTQMFLLVLLFTIFVWVMLSSCKRRKLGVISNLSMSKNKTGLRLWGMTSQAQGNRG